MDSEQDYFEVGILSSKINDGNFELVLLNDYF